MSFSEQLSLCHFRIVDAAALKKSDFVIDAKHEVSSLASLLSNVVFFRLYGLLLVSLSIDALMVLRVDLSTK